MVVAVLAGVAGLGPPHFTYAKFATSNIWLVGGDLPHPVKIPSEELANPGTRQGESFQLYPNGPSWPLGPGYDLVVGADLATALSTLQLNETYETVYPDTHWPDMVAFWQPLRTTYSTRPEDRNVSAWDSVSGGLYAAIPRYVALAKAGLIGEQPTLHDAVVATEQLMGVQGLLDTSSLATHDIETLTYALPSLTQIEVPLQESLPSTPFYHVQLTLGTGNRATDLQYIYVPPGWLSSAGLLFPQLGPEPKASSPAQSATAYQTTKALDGLFARYGAAAPSTAGQPAMARFPSTGTGARPARRLLYTDW